MPNSNQDAAASPISPATVGTAGVFISGVALVVSTSTFVSDFTGFIRLGAGFVVALVLGFVAIVPVALASADIAVCHPRIGGIYQFARSILRGSGGRRTALFFSLGFFCAFLFGSAGETMAGAHALRALLGSDRPASWFLPILVLPALAANLRGVRCATWVTGGLLAVMLSVRWGFGLAGFAGLAHTGDWSAANLAPQGGWNWWGANGLLAAGVAFGFWSFVGIEGSVSLVDVTRNPRRSLPRGMLLGLVTILVTTGVMGVGSIGTQGSEAWTALIAAQGADAPQLAIAGAMFGTGGRFWMALASVAATWSTLLIAFAAVPRMIAAVAADGMFLGPLSQVFAKVNPRTGVPVRATLLVVSLQFAVTLRQEAVVECLEAAAYLWFLRYLVILGLAWRNRANHPAAQGVLSARLVRLGAAVGSALVAAGWWFGFAGQHARLGLHALIFIAVALVVAVISARLRNRRPEPVAVPVAGPAVAT